MRWSKRLRMTKLAVGGYTGNLTTYFYDNKYNYPAFAAIYTAFITKSPFPAPVTHNFGLVKN
jgi:hypothetical protein